MVSVGEQPCQYLFRQPLGKYHDQQATVPLPANQAHWPMPYHSFVLDLEQTGPGRHLPQKQSRSQVVAQTPQFLQPQGPDSQLQLNPHYSLVLDPGRTKQRKGCNLGPLLRRMVDVYTDSA